MLRLVLRVAEIQPRQDDEADAHSATYDFDLLVAKHTEISDIVGFCFRTSPT